MTPPTVLRRTYTIPHRDEDNSSLISSIDSTTESESDIHASRKKSGKDIVKNTSKTELGQSSKKYNVKQSVQ